MTVEAGRPEISVYWVPGCSSCLKLKEFVEERGLVFESLNLLEREDAVQELEVAGFRGAAILRKGDAFVRGQNLDEVAALLGVDRHHRRLANSVLVERWEELLACARAVIAWFPEDVLDRRAVLVRDRPIRDLCTHVFQVPDTFLRRVEGSLAADGERAALGAPVDHVETKDELLAFVDAILARFRSWRVEGGEAELPERMLTYYGEQPIGQVLERGTWHTAQHARQLDTIAAGLGAEFQIPLSLYEGLPMPGRLWA